MLIIHIDLVILNHVLPGKKIEVHMFKSDRSFCGFKMFLFRLKYESIGTINMIKYIDGFYIVFNTALYYTFY